MFWQDTSFPVPHLPEPILAIIISCVSHDGVDALKNFIAAGPEVKNAALSLETLSSVCLIKSQHIGKMHLSTSVYFSFFSKCLKQKNPYALYMESLRTAFCSLDLVNAIAILKDIRDLFPLAKLAYIMLNSQAGTQDLVVFKQFRSEQSMFHEVEELSHTLLNHIESFEPKRWGTFAETWQIEQSPHCWQIHEHFQEYNGERCWECIYYFLSRDICLLS